MENKQTAVEWLVDEIKIARILCDDSNIEMDIFHTLDVLIKKGEQAKEMEKEQIKEAYRSFNCFFPSEYNIDDEDCILMMKIAKNTLNKHTEVTNDTTRKSKRNLL
jgi:deoxyhypusine synthase